MTKTKTSSKSGCGCGGGCGGNCGCGGTSKGGCCNSTKFPGTPITASSCDPCEEGAFVRPRFFAGQLLTEDDLEAINTYMIGKNRLHNARLWGDGVVCGFEVVCGPCGGDTVIVRPGYALDCCGNDLVLGCDRKLDIGDMIASLREQMHPGHGCADPCVDQTKPKECVPAPDEKPDDKGEGKVEGRVEMAARRMATMLDHDARDEDDLATTPRRGDEFCLYVRYHETQAEPTAPYPVGDACGTGPCEATRVIEGVTFELRCKPPEEPKRDLLARLVRFIAQLSPDGRIMDQLRFLQYFARRAEAAVARVQEYEITKRLEVDQAHQLRLRQVLERLTDPSIAEETRTELLAIWVAESGNFVRSTKEAATAAQPKGKKAVAVEERELPYEEAAKRFAAPTETYNAYTRLGQEAVALYQTYREKNPAIDDITDPSLKLYAFGFAHTPKQHEFIWNMFHDVRDTFHRVTQSDRDPTDCHTKYDLAQLSPYRELTGDRVSIQELARLARVIRKLLQIVFGIIRDRVCVEVIPPCPPCDDPAVLLACLRIVDCNVTEICNLERKFVLSPRALRHWFPLDALGETFEKLCCSTTFDDLEEKYEYGRTKQMLSEQLVRSRPDAAVLAQVVSRVYADAPQPTALRKAVRTLVPDKLGTKVSDQTYVTREEMYRILDEYLGKGG